MKNVIDYLALSIALISIAIIVYGTAVAVTQFVRSRMKNGALKIRKIRVDYGGYLLFGLELLIGADIIRTIVEPTYEELIILGGIVAIRTLLSVFLNKEIKELQSD